jgi:hypothetical protein
MPILTARGHERGLLFDLLACAAADPSLNPVKGMSPRRLGKVDDRQMQWVIEAGLAPLLYRVSREGIRQAPAALRDMLLSADLTAKVRHGNLIDATREIVEACEAHGARVTLLKGISIADQYYPAAHLRPMGDIDILAQAPSHEMVESTILQLGYRREPDHVQRDGAHHGAPLFHPERRVWVELHNALFSEDTALRCGHVFSPAHVAAHCVPSTFHGSAVYRLSDEMQLVYVASSWAWDLSRYGIHASFVPPLLDALYLLKATKSSLDWDRLLGWLDNPVALASLHVMLTYLSRHSLCQVDPQILARLASSREVIGPPAVRIIHGMLDKYLMGGQPFSQWFNEWHASIALGILLAPGAGIGKLASIPWNIVFPRSVAERYSVRYQLGRIARLVRGGA